LAQFTDAAGPLSVVWLVVLMNIVNLSDGVDGLAAGVCAIDAAAFALIAFNLQGGASDAAVLAALPNSAYVINIARGRVIDEAALIAALRTGGIAGAALDVFDTEPLPKTSPLWSFDNVIVTPRIGGMSDIYAEQILPLLLHNLRAFLAGDLSAMRNRVAISRAGDSGVHAPVRSRDL